RPLHSSASSAHPHSFLLLTRHPPRSPLFPYTTLFRSWPSTATSSSSQRGPASARCPQSTPPDSGSLRSAIAWPARSSLAPPTPRSEEHTSELQSLTNLVCRLLLEKKKTPRPRATTPST